MADFGCIISDYNARENEVNTYFSFLGGICEPDQSILAGTVDFDKVQLLKILKANAFVILYNLVESTYLSAHKFLADEINSHYLNYKDAIPEIRKIWIKHVRKYFDDNNKSTKKIDHIYNILENISETVVTTPESLKGLDVSGNLDRQKIKECMALYGFDDAFINCTFGTKLVTVKANRNHLAHGEKSFSECGQDYTFNDLDVVKQDVFKFLRHILSEYNSKISSKYYQLTT